jgi:hypothetical protein
MGIDKLILKFIWKQGAQNNLNNLAKEQDSVILAQG